MRSHAQKVNNKANNDREKIGYQPGPVRKENEIAITRSKTYVRPNSQKEQDLKASNEKSKQIKKEA